MLRTKNLSRFNEDYKTYSKLVFGVSVHILLATQEAEEVVQEVFLKYAEEFDTVENPKYWLVRAATNMSIDKHRRRKTFRNYADKVVNSVRTAFITISTRSAVKKELRGILESLNEKDRSLLTLKLGHGYQYEEIAEILGIPEGSVKSALSRLLKRLKDQRGSQE